MINPKIFYYFKKALKWEIIIICASFAFIMPWQNAHAVTMETTNTSGFMYWGTTVITSGTISPNNLRLWCEENGASGGSDSMPDIFNMQRYRCETSGGSPRYPDGKTVLVGILNTSITGLITSRDGDLLQDEQGNYYPGHPNYVPSAPDIESCTRELIPINIGKEGSPEFPNLNDIYTDPDGCQYKINTTQPGFVIEDCDKDPVSGDVICLYKVQPSGTIPPPDPAPDVPEMPSNGQPTTTPIQDDSKNDLIVDWSSWEPNPPHSEEFIDPDNIVTITLPDGGTVDVTIAPDGTISIDYGDYSPNEVPIIRGPNGYPQPNPGYSPPGGGSPGAGGPSGGSPDGPVGVPGVGGTGGGDGSGNGDGDGSGGAFCEYAEVVCDFIDWIKEPFVEPEPVDVPYVDIDFEEDYDSGITVATCPAPISIVTQFGTVQFDWSNVCSLAEMIRPLVIAFSYLIGIYILLRVK